MQLTLMLSAIKSQPVLKLTMVVTPYVQRKPLPTVEEFIDVFQNPACRMFADHL